MRLSRGRKHGSEVRQERAALLWAVYRNCTPAQGRKFNRELKERLQESLNGDGYRQASTADPQDPANATSYGRARTAQILQLCAEGK